MEIPPKDVKRIELMLRAMIVLDLIAAGIIAWIQVAK